MAFYSLVNIHLSLRGDVSSVSLATSAGETASDGLCANVHLARTGLEATYEIDCFGDVEVNPFGLLHFRKDGGDGDTGSGFEFAGALRLGYKSVSVELVTRSFEIRGPKRYSERGLSVTATVNPSLDGSGFSASISPRWVPRRTQTARFGVILRDLSGTLILQ